jgi:hypothetical protein
MGKSQLGNNDAGQQIKKWIQSGRRPHARGSAWKILSRAGKSGGKENEQGGKTEAGTRLCKNENEPPTHRSKSHLGKIKWGAGIENQPHLTEKINAWSTCWEPSPTAGDQIQKWLQSNWRLQSETGQKKPENKIAMHHSDPKRNREKKTTTPPKQDLQYSFFIEFKQKFI